MTPGPGANKFPKSARILKSEDFGSVLRAQGPGSIRLGRDSVSVCAQAHRQAGLVRFGFTVGKKKQFFEELDRLKQSDIVIDKETLELIRTFS